MRNKWWRLPGCCCLFERIITSLRESKNVILKLPRDIAPGLKTEFQRYVEDQEMVWTDINADSDTSPVEYLFDLFIPDAAPDSIKNINTLLERDEFLGRIIWLSGINRRNWEKWYLFIQDYQYACKNIPSYLSTLFIAVLMDELAQEQVSKEVCLVEHSTKGIITSIDMKLFVYQLIQERSLNYLTKEILVSVISALAIWDDDLAIQLSEQELESILNPFELLNNFAREKGWTKELHKSDNRWILGITDYINGTEIIHSAFLPLINQEKEVNRRIWKAEVEILFPYVEEKRQEIIKKISNYLEVPFVTNQGIRIEDIYDLEIGHLDYQLSYKNIPCDIRKQISILKRIRNSLAHFQPISGGYLFTDKDLFN